MPSDVTDELEPLEVFVDKATGVEVPLPPRLRDFYGRLALPMSGARPGVIANFVQTIDGVVTLDAGTSSGGAISGKNPHDRAVMALLRATADAVVVGAGTLRSVPDHLWTAEYIHPGWASDYNELRIALSKPAYPLNVIVTATGELDPAYAIFQQTDIPVLVITSEQGAGRARRLPATVEFAMVSGEEVSPEEILHQVAERTAGQLVLSEAGPKLSGEFLAAKVVDDLFVSVAPQVAGRDDCAKRPGLISGREFAPDDPRWLALVSLRRAEAFLFLRYSATQ